MLWFYWNAGERIGPISAAELKRLAQSGVVSPSTTVEDETGKSALAERVAGLFAAPSELAEARFNRFAETLASFEKRLDELTERLERVATRVADVEEKAAKPNAAFPTLETRFEEWDAALTAVVGKIDALTDRASSVERRLGEERRQAKGAGVASLRTSGESVDAFELSAGKYRVGTDVPPGRYRAALRRGYGGVTVKSRDDYQSYFLNTDVADDSYNPSCVLELRSGAKLTLDRPTDFTYLGALR